MSDIEKFKQVSEEEFNLFIKDYPNKLVSNVNQICEPPFKGYYDLSISNKADENSNIAYIELNEVYGEINKYFIK